MQDRLDEEFLEQTKDSPDEAMSELRLKLMMRRAGVPERKIEEVVNQLDSAQVEDVESNLLNEVEEK